MQAKGLIILDKDGTLVKPFGSDRFVRHPRDQQLLPGVKEAIAQERRKGWDIAIASNQGGIQAGYKTLEDTIEEMVYAMELTGIDRAVFCPDSGLTLYQVRLICGKRDVHHRTILHDECREINSFRKPAPGMLEWLLRCYGADSAMFVGDRPEDRQAAMHHGNVVFTPAEDWRKWALMPPVLTSKKRNSQPEGLESVSIQFNDIDQADT